MDKLDLSLTDIIKAERAEPIKRERRRPAARGLPYARPPGLTRPRNLRRPMENLRRPMENLRRPMESKLLGSPKSCLVFVEGLPTSSTWQSVKDLMREAGSVRHVDVPLNYEGQSLGTATVEFDDAESTLRAKRLFQNKILPGSQKKVTVRLKASPSLKVHPGNSTGAAQEIRQRAPPDCQVFVGNLPYDTQWQQLKDTCAPFGNVLRADVEMDEKGRSKGFGTVVFATRVEAHACIRGLSGVALGGRKLVVHQDLKAAQQQAPVRTSNGQSSQNGGYRVYVGNLPWSCTWQELKDMGNRVGRVQFADLATEPSGRSRGFGVLTFFDAAEAFKAITALNKTMYQGRELLAKVDERHAERGI